jgi:hypothetical protein
VVIGTGAADEFMVTLIEAAHCVVFGEPAPKLVAHSPARWPSLFKKLSK